jgi:hypothetical protein
VIVRLRKKLPNKERMALMFLMNLGLFSSLWDYLFKVFSSELSRTLISYIVRQFLAAIHL